MGKINCRHCKTSCKDKAVKHNEDYYHVSCFVCSECEGFLCTDSFYIGDNGGLLCEDDFVKLFSKICGGCGSGVEGEVLCILNTIFHKECLSCSTCRKPFEEGDKVTAIADEYLCSDCFDSGADESGLKEKQTLVNDSENRQKSAINTKSTTEDNQPNYGQFYKQSYLKNEDRPIRRVISFNASEPSPKHYHRPVDFSYSQVVRDFIRPPKRESSILLSSLDKETDKKKGVRRVGEVVMGMNNKEAVKLARLPDGRLKVKLKDQESRDGLEKGDIEHKEKERDVDDEDEIDLVTGLKRIKVSSGLRLYAPTINSNPLFADLFKQVPPPQIYAYEELKVTNFKLPFGVDKENIEKHLSEDEFTKLFRMPMCKYYELPEWRRNDMKRRVHLY